MSITINGTTGIAGTNGSAGTPAVQGEDTNTGIFFPAADTVAVATAGTERLRVDSSGNLLVGTTVSTQKLSMQRNTSIGWVNAAGNGSDQIIYADGASNLNFYTNATERARISSVGFLGIGTSSPAVAVHVSGATTGAATIRTQASSGGAGQFQAQTDGSIFTMQAVSGGGLRFVQEDVAERARIDASGNLFVGGTVSGTQGALSIQPRYSTGSGNFVAATALVYWNRVQSASVGTAALFQDGGNTVGSITHTNTSTSYVTSSDYRLKENVAPMQNALDTVAQLNPVTYTWKADGSAGQGFIAHELQAVVPDCVTGEKDAVDETGNPQYQGVDTSFLVATLVAAIKELTARVAQLEAQ